MKMKKITLLMATAMIALSSQAQIPGMTGLYTFSNQDDLFANTAPVGPGTGVMKCDGVMKYDPEATDASADDMASEELTDWMIIDGINDKAISLNAFNWLKIWHGIPANGGGSYVNNFSVVMDVRISCDTCIYSLLDVNPTPRSNGYESEMEIDYLQLGSVDLPWFTAGTPYSTFVFETDTWYRISYVARLSEYIIMYVNGVEWNRWEGDVQDGRPAPYGADLDPTSAAMKIGGNNQQATPAGPQRDFDKDINAVALFEVTLTADEVAALGGPETDILGKVTGIESTDGAISRLNLYPNPASTSIYISGDDLKNVEIISVSGARVMYRELKGNNSVDISMLSKGMYFVKVMDNHLRVAVEKLIVK